MYHDYILLHIPPIFDRKISKNISNRLLLFDLEWNKSSRHHLPNLFNVHEIYIKISGCRGITAVRFISEEVFGSNKALWFSPSGNKLAFGYFDDSQTPIITIPFYGYPGSMSFQYTTAISIHYPKVSVSNQGGGREEREEDPSFAFRLIFRSQVLRDSRPGFRVRSWN